MTSLEASLRNKSVVVTGVNGFVGRHLKAALKAGGARVVSFAGDIREARAEDIGAPDVVFHLAALTDMRRCRENPEEAFEVNVRGTLRLLTASKNAKKFVYVSTLGVYGEPKYVPVDERHPTEPIEPYAASKLAGEAAVRGVCMAEGRTYAIARLFNVYGPGQRLDFVIPKLMEEIRVSDTVSIRNATSTRDFVHVDDVVMGLIAIALRGENDVYNIGTGVETSIRNLASIIARFTNPAVSLIVQGVDGGGVKRSVADIGHTREKIGWNASIFLEKGIQTMLS